MSLNVAPCKFRHEGGARSLLRGHQRSSAVISGHQRSSAVISGHQRPLRRHPHLQVSSRRARLESDPEETVGILSEGDGHGDSGEHETHLLMREALRGH